MKITAGLGCIDDYVRLVKAGADEVFCGFVPYEWNRSYKTLFPLNRREVLYSNVQIGSLEDMKILKKMVDKYKVPVSITFNYIYYLEEQYKLIKEIIKDLMEIGFNDFIIADLALLVYLKKENIDCSIHLSGECTEINTLSMKVLNEFNISRYIFHRKNTISDMKSCIEKNNKDNLEYEAFILNEKCHYTGAFCSSFHCDELAHLCKVPYELGKISDENLGIAMVEEKLNSEPEEIESENYEYKLGSSGCGICALKKLKEAGVTHLKVVGRGNYIDIIEKDIVNLKKAIKIMNSIGKEEKFIENIKDEFFGNDCSGECYY